MTVCSKNVSVDNKVRISQNDKETVLYENIVIFRMELTRGSFLEIHKDFNFT